jgi:hypothetical protein
MVNKSEEAQISFMHTGLLVVTDLIRALTGTKQLLLQKKV